MFLRSPTGRSAFSRGRTCFSTGTDSPVRAASSTCRLIDSSRRPSAGTRSPVCSRITSPGHQVARRDLDLFPVAQHGGRRRRHLAQRFDGPLGAVLLHKAQQHGEQHDDGDDHRFDAVPQQQRERRGNQQDQDEHVLELLQQDLESRDAIWRPGFRWGRSLAGVFPPRRRSARSGRCLAPGKLRLGSGCARVGFA